MAPGTARLTVKRLLTGIAIGVLALAAIRFAFVQPTPPTHYHANFAIFVDGRRLDLSADRYMEELSACRVKDTAISPTERVHLHSHNPDVVHVHQSGVTWGDLLANLGLGVGDRYLVTPDGVMLPPGNNSTLKFILNGRAEPSINNKLIRSRDRLLISYGPETEAEVTRSQFPLVASTAERYNQGKDPAGCSGAPVPTFWERVQHVFVG